MSDLETRLYEAVARGHEAAQRGPYTGYPSEEIDCISREVIKECKAEIARLTERCDAYLGQVKAGDEQILALRSRAKEMQREKVELRQRCDAYKEALEKYCVVEEYDSPGDAPEFCGYTCIMCPGTGATKAEVDHVSGCALATLKDKTP